MGVSRLSEEIAESPTLKLNDRARALRDSGENLVHLGIGEPKNAAPLNALLNAAAKLTDGCVKYTPTSGLPALKCAISRYTLDYYQREVEPQNILVSNGAKQALYNIFLSIIDPGDEVVVLAPYWVSYPEMIKMAHGVPVVLQPDQEDFRHSVDAVQQAVGEKTKAILINSPNNPSGVVYDADFIQAMVEFGESHGIYIIMDDIYHRLVFDGTEAAGALQYAHDDLEKTHVLLVNGVSKLFGMTGFRIGWVIAPSYLIAAMTKFQAQTTSNPSMVSQVAAEGALNGSLNVVEGLRLQMQNNRNVMLTELSAIPDINVVTPAGTFYCLPDFSAHGQDSTALAERLLEKARVVTVPGAAFGMEGHLRLSYAGTIRDIREGVRRIQWAVDPRAPRTLRIGEKEIVRDWL